MNPKEQVRNENENENDCPDCGHPLNWYESILQWLCPDCDSEFIDSQEGEFE